MFIAIQPAVVSNHRCDANVFVKQQHVGVADLVGLEQRTGVTAPIRLTCGWFP
jgi:hypothetical protein